MGAKYISVSQAAEIMGVDPRFVRTLCKKKKIAAMQLGDGETPEDNAGLPWIVLRSAAEAYERIPGRGRPKAPKKRKPKRS